MTITALAIAVFGVLVSGAIVALGGFFIWALLTALFSPGSER